MLGCWLLREEVQCASLGRGGDAGLRACELDRSLSARSEQEHEMGFGHCKRAAFGLLASQTDRTVLVIYNSASEAVG